MLGIWVFDTRAEPMISLVYYLNGAPGKQCNHFAWLISSNRFSFKIPQVVYPEALPFRKGPGF